jgi:hypothetical protein
MDKVELSDSIVNTGTWIFVAGVLNGGGAAANLRIFVNGVEEIGAIFSLGSSTDIVDTIPRKVRIGWRSNDNPIEIFVGDIDEVSLYNRALSASEIHAIFKAGGSGVCKEPIFCNGQPVTILGTPGPDCGYFWP